MLIRRELGEQDEASLSAPGRRRHRKPSRSRAGPAAYHLSPCLAYPFSALSIANRAAPTYRAVSSLDPLAPKILRQHSLTRKSERTDAMATFLSLPDEVLLVILKIACVKHWSEQRRRGLAIFGVNQRLREFGIEAAAAEVCVNVDEDGIVDDEVMRWMQRHQAWRHIRHLTVWYGGLGCISRVPTISALALPAQPISAKVGVYCVRGRPLQFPRPRSSPSHTTS
jgi:hypothetical protein